MSTNISTRRIKPKIKASEISIDSLKIRIPLENVKGVTPEITAKRFVVNSVSGAVERELKSKGEKILQDGISTYYAIQSQPTGYGTATKDYIKLIYSELMRILPVEFSYNDFLSGECTDVDFKTDMVTPNFSSSLKTIVLHAKKHGRRDYGYNLFSGAKSKGIEFTKREKATPSNPFLKLYDKSLELTNKSNEFKEKHLDSSNVVVDKNLIRIEFTLKNKKHFRKYKIDNTSLNALLKLKKKKKRKILKKIVEIHLEPRVRKPYIIGNLSPTDSAIVTLANMLMEQGSSYEIIKMNVLSQIEKRSSKHSLKNRLDNLYATVIQGTKTDKITRKQDKFFNALGWS